VLDLQSEVEDLLDRFSRDARRNIQDSSREDFRIETGGPSEIESIISMVRNRYGEQGKQYWLENAELVCELHRTLPDKKVRPYVLYQNGQFAGGIIALEHGNTIYRWIGGVKPQRRDLSLNDLLNWQIIRDAVDSAVLNSGVFVDGQDLIRLIGR